MKISDLPNDTNVQTVKVRLSESLYECSSLPDYGIDDREVYLMGPMMGDWFVKTDPGDTQIYPMYREMITWEELKDLEVVSQ